MDVLICAKPPFPWPRSEMCVKAQERIRQPASPLARDIVRPHSAQLGRSQMITYPAANWRVRATPFGL